jgi:hypothetical protein
VSHAGRAAEAAVAAGAAEADVTLA